MDDADFLRAAIFHGIAENIFSAARSSGRLSAVIGTPAVDQTCSRFGQ
jgi:hypothetical protein